MIHYVRSLVLFSLTVALSSMSCSSTWMQKTRTGLSTTRDAAAETQSRIKGDPFCHPVEVWCTENRLRDCGPLASCHKIKAKILEEFAKIDEAAKRISEELTLYEYNIGVKEDR